MVLSRDIMTVPVEEIMETKVLATAIDGRVVYGGVVRGKGEDEEGCERL